MVKIRLEGLPDELKAAIENLRKQFYILSQSDFYPNKNSVYYRVYLDVTEKKN